MNVYCDHQSTETNSIAFIFDVHRLHAEQIPDELEMEDEDDDDDLLPNDWPSDDDFAEVVD